jgi:hypothetical protein
VGSLVILLSGKRAQSHRRAIHAKIAPLPS